MSGAKTSVVVSVAAGVRIGRAEAIYEILAFAFDVLRLRDFKRILHEGIRRRQWLGSVCVTGVQADGKIAEELTFAIDWDRHRVHVAEGRDIILVSDGRSVVAATSPELLTTLRLFKDSCRERGLTLDVYWRYRDSDAREQARAQGLSQAFDAVYAGPPMRAAIGMGELDEVSASYARYGAS